MSKANELLEKIKEYQNLDYEEVYVDERYEFTPYMKVEELFEEFTETVKSLHKDEATKTLVQFVKSAESNIQSRYLITCDFRQYAATESAKSAAEAFDAIEKLLNMDFSPYVNTAPEKISLALKRMQALIAQFMITPRSIVVYERKDPSEYSEATLTVSPSTIVEFDPMTLSSEKNWKQAFDEVKEGIALPTQEEYKDYIEKHRIVKEYIKNEPKSKSMYRRKGYEKTYNYIREVKQTQKMAMFALGVVAVIVIYFLFFN